MELNNNRINEILHMDDEDYDNEIIDEFIGELKNARLIIPTEIPDDFDIENMKEGETIDFDETSKFNIIKLEDDENNEFIPVFTGDVEIESLEIPGYGLVMQTEDLANLLYDTEINNEKLVAILINPFTDYPAEMEFLHFLELFDLVEIECDDPNCQNEHHHY